MCVLFCFLNIILNTLKTGSLIYLFEAVSGGCVKLFFCNTPYDSQQQHYLSRTEVAAVFVEEAAVRWMAWEVGSNPSEKAASDMAVVLWP